MRPTGFFTGATRKIVVVGTTIALGLGTAAGAAAVVLPKAVQHHTNAAITTSAHGAFGDPAASTAAAAVRSHTGAGAGAGAGVSASIGASVPATGQVSATAGAGLSTGTGVKPAASGATHPDSDTGTGFKLPLTAGGAKAGANAGATLKLGRTPLAGAAGAESGLVNAIEGCLSSVTGGVTANPFTAIGSVIPAVVTCVQNILKSLPVPTMASTCINGLLNSLANLPSFFTTGNAMFNLGGCVPVDLTTCIQAAFNAVGGIMSGHMAVGTALNTVESCATSIVQDVLNLVQSILGQVTGTVGGVTNGPGLGFSTGIKGSLPVRP